MGLFPLHGMFPNHPQFAVCSDPLAESISFEMNFDRGRGKGAAIVVSGRVSNLNPVQEETVDLIPDIRVD
jgi:hypothetical protein